MTVEYYQGWCSETDYGHSLFYTACSYNDDKGIGSTSDTFINILYPNTDQEVEITISTNQMAYHPFVRSNREYFDNWREMVLEVVRSIPDTSFADYEVK